RQEIDGQGRQVEHPESWDPSQWATRLGAKTVVILADTTVWISAWLYVLKSHMHGEQPVILLDTDLPENQEEDRQLTHFLYGGDDAYRLKQEFILGVGGVRMLRALGFDVRQYHMNEGHSAMLALELLRLHAYPPEGIQPGESLYDIPRVRELCCFTTHTPVDTGHDHFSYNIVQQILDGFIDLTILKRLAGQDNLNMTRLALNLSEYINGVAKRHAEVSRKMFPGYRVRAITNGVHPHTWASPDFAKLYDQHMPGWCHEPELLVRADCCIPDASIWEAHDQAKRHLIEKVATLTGIKLKTKMPILGFARRMTAYKRPELIFSDLQRLAAIAQQWPFQIVLAGKAHARDEAGKGLIETLHKYIGQLKDSIPMAFLPNYDMDIALAMVSGVDVWLNTPLRPLEASGTSGMKACFNGVPNLSVLDGWWIEGCIEGVTGWAIGDSKESANGDDAKALYDKLEHTVLPLYYQDRTGWIRMMKGAISKNASFFNSHRMMRRYATEAYLR
ncbi:MAG TPA: alpha-glucan family phosphorylase, partial [Gammaproteobacteria bacterium]